MRVIKHGNKYEFKVITCDKCDCRFAITLDDVKTEQYTDYSSYDRDTYDVTVTKCPECNNIIEVKIEEFNI